jgi:uncharacterized protein YbaR (Trm112 family)
MKKEIAAELLNILVCPLSKESLVYDKKRQELICAASGLAYQIEDGIPIMIPDLARKIQNKRPPIKAARKNALQNALRKNLSRRKESK